MWYTLNFNEFTFSRVVVLSIFLVNPRFKLRFSDDCSRVYLIHNLNVKIYLLKKEMLNELIVNYYI